MGSLVRSRRTVLKAAVNFAGFAVATRIPPVGSAGTQVVGRMASEAKVKAVVLNHIVGGPGPNGTLESFESGLVESARKVFAGPVTVGRDQMRFQRPNKEE